MKKYIIIGLAVILIATMFVGCSGSIELSDKGYLIFTMATSDKESTTLFA